MWRMSRTLQLKYEVHRYKQHSILILKSCYKQVIKVAHVSICTSATTWYNTIIAVDDFKTQNDKI